MERTSFLRTMLAFYLCYVFFVFCSAMLMILDGGISIEYPNSFSFAVAMIFVPPVLLLHSFVPYLNNPIVISFFVFNLYSFYSLWRLRFSTTTKSNQRVRYVLIGWAGYTLLLLLFYLTDNSLFEREHSYFRRDIPFGYSPLANHLLVYGFFPIFALAALSNK